MFDAASSGENSASVTSARIAGGNDFFSQGRDASAKAHQSAISNCHRHEN
jgi:hypothetical protein